MRTHHLTMHMLTNAGLIYLRSSDIVVSGLSGFGEHGSIFPSASEAPQIWAGEVPKLSLLLAKHFTVAI